MSTNTPGRENGHDTRAGSTTTTTDAHATVAETADTWSGPHQERDRYGHLTGAAFVRCRDCGVEVPAGQRERATHREGCRHGDDGDR